MKKNIFIIILVLIVFNAYSEETVNDAEEMMAPAILFNTNNILLDIESFQSGIGMKFSINDLTSIRLITDFYYSNSLNTFSGAIGVSYFKYFTEIKRINPYAGFFTNFRYITQSTIIDENNWTRSGSIPMSAGAFLGVEFFLLNFLSLFAEYNLELNLDIQMASTSVDNTVTRQPNEYSSEIDTGIGNNSAIGIAIYLDEVIDSLQN